MNYITANKDPECGNPTRKLIHLCMFFLQGISFPNPEETTIGQGTVAQEYKSGRPKEATHMVRAQSKQYCMLGTFCRWRADS